MQRSPNRRLRGHLFVATTAEPEMVLRRQLHRVGASESVCRSLHANKLWLITSYTPYNKLHAHGAPMIGLEMCVPFLYRLAMAQLAASAASCCRSMRIAEMSSRSVYQWCTSNSPQECIQFKVTWVFIRDPICTRAALEIRKEFRRNSAGIPQEFGRNSAARFRQPLKTGRINPRGPRP